MTAPRLLVIIASTRPGRIGLPVGEWFRDHATAHGAFTVQVADLAAIDLPFLDEPAHPRLRQYTHQHTKDWSALVDAADAFAFVFPEYNFGLTAPLKNALDFLNQEWREKPVGLVSYGGVSAGLRAAGMVRQVTTALAMMPLPEAVSLPFVHSLIGDDGKIHPNDTMTAGADVMLDQLARWAAALRTLRLPPDHASPESADEA